MRSPSPLHHIPLRDSLLAKTLLIVGVAAAAVATVIVLVASSYIGQRAREQAMGRLNELVDSMSVMANIACYTKDVTLARETAQAFVKNSDVAQVTIMAYGKELARAGHPAVGGGSGMAAQTALRRPLFSPFVPDEHIGEVIVDPNGVEIQNKAAESVRSMTLSLVLLVSGIFVVLTLVVTYFVIRPVKLISSSRAGSNRRRCRGHAGRARYERIGAFGRRHQRMGGTSEGIAAASA